MDEGQEGKGIEYHPICSIQQKSKDKKEDLDGEDFIDKELDIASADEEEDKKYPFMCLSEVVRMKREIKKNKKIVFDITDTIYKVIKSTGTNIMGWTTVSGNCAREDWNLVWYDSYISEEVLRKMLPYQKVNHFPGSFHLGKKNYLSQNLLKMRKVLEEDYSFYPRTWNLPVQFEDFKRNNESYKGKKPYYIVKPESSCQGRGIYLTKKVEGFTYNDHCVIQEYIKNPFLIDGLKFDFRIYVLIKSVFPLKIFMYPEGLARFATVKYAKPNKKNCGNFMMHLTNYAVNKKSPDFVFNSDDRNDGIGHKRSFSSVLKQLHNEGHNMQKLYMEIRQLIVKTIISVQPQLAHMYRSSQPREHQNEMCFEILGFDVMIDDKLKPWLLEVNHSASFHCDSPLDSAIKKNVILDTFNLIHISSKEKKQFFDQKVQAQFAFRKKETTTQTIDQSSQEKQIFKYEENHKGAYIRIFPSEDDPTDYLKLLNIAGITWKESVQPRKGNVVIQSPIKIKSSQIKKLGNGIQALQQMGKTTNEPLGSTQVMSKKKFQKDDNEQSSVCCFLPSLSKVGSLENINEGICNDLGDNSPSKNRHEKSVELSELFLLKEHYANDEREGEEQDLELEVLETDKDINQMRELNESPLSKKRKMIQVEVKSKGKMEKNAYLNKEKDSNSPFMVAHSQNFISKINSSLLSDQSFSHSFQLIQQQTIQTHHSQMDQVNPLLTQSSVAKWQISQQCGQINNSLPDNQMKYSSSIQTGNSIYRISTPNTHQSNSIGRNLNTGQNKIGTQTIIVNNVNSLYDSLVREDGNIFKSDSHTQSVIDGSNPVTIRETMNNSLHGGESQNLKKLNVVNLGMNLKADLISDPWCITNQKPLYVRMSARKSQKNQLRPLHGEFQRLMVRETRGSQLGVTLKDNMTISKNVVSRMNQPCLPISHFSERKQQMLSDASDQPRFQKKQSSVPPTKTNLNTQTFNNCSSSINTGAFQRLNLSNLVNNSNNSQLLNASTLILNQNTLIPISKELASISPKKRPTGRSAERKQIKNLIINENIMENKRQEQIQKGIAGTQNYPRHRQNESLENYNELDFEKKQLNENLGTYNNSSTNNSSISILEPAFSNPMHQNIFLRPKGSSLSSQTNLKSQGNKVSSSITLLQNEIISVPNPQSWILHKAKASPHLQK